MGGSCRYKDFPSGYPPPGGAEPPPLLRNDFGLCVGRGDLTPPKARHNMPFPVRIRRGGIYAARIPPASALFPPQPKNTQTAAKTVCVFAIFNRL